jgi:hypothetical protein
MHHQRVKDAGAFRYAERNYLQQDYTATTPHDYLSLIAPLTEGEHIVEAVQAHHRGIDAAIFDLYRHLVFVMHHQRVKDAGAFRYARPMIICR